MFCFDCPNVTGAVGAELFIGGQLVLVVEGITDPVCCCCDGGYCQTGWLFEYGTLAVDFCWPLIIVLLLAKDAPAGLLGEGEDAICSEAKSPS